MTHFVVASADGTLVQACSSTQAQAWILTHWPRQSGEIIVWVAAPLALPLSAWRVEGGVVVPAGGG